LRAKGHVQPPWLLGQAGSLPEAGTESESSERVPPPPSQGFGRKNSYSPALSSEGKRGALAGPEHPIRGRGAGSALPPNPLSRVGGGRGAGRSMVCCCLGGTISTKHTINQPRAAPWVHPARGTAARAPLPPPR